MADAKPVKVIFGERYPGDIRVMIGAEEIPNIRSVKLLEVEPGELPQIQIRMLAPRLEIEDKTQGDVQEMVEVDLPLSPVTMVETKSASPKAASSKKSSK